MTEPDPDFICSYLPVTGCRSPVIGYLFLRATHELRLHPPSVGGSVGRRLVGARFIAPCTARRGGRDESRPYTGPGRSSVALMTRS